MSFREYAKLCHLQTASQIIVTPIIGALAVVYPITWFEIILLILIGLCVNVFGFTHNEYLDVEVDSASVDLADKPLVKGTVPKEHAKFLACGSLTAAYVIIIIFFPRPIPIIIFSISIALAGIYNWIGKKYAGIDFLLGGWAFFLCMFGALVFTEKLNTAVYIFSSLFLLQWWFANIVEGGIKDAEHDFQIGVRNTTTFWGVRVKRGKFIMPVTYKTFGMGLTLAYVILIALAFLYFGFELQNWQLVILLIPVAAVLFSVVKLLTIKKFNRDSILQFIIVSEFGKAFIPPIILVSLIGWPALLLIPFIFFWSAIFMLYEYGTSPPSI